MERLEKLKIQWKKQKRFIIRKDREAQEDQDQGRELWEARVQGRVELGPVLLG